VSSFSLASSSDNNDFRDTRLDPDDFDDDDEMWVRAAGVGEVSMRAAAGGEVLGWIGFGSVQVLARMPACLIVAVLKSAGLDCEWVFGLGLRFGSNMECWMWFKLENV